MELQPILPIDDEDIENIDIAKPPVTPSEYLKQVRLQASKCAQVVISDMDTSIFEKNMNYKLPNIIDEVYNTDCWLLPDKQAQKNIINDFIKVKEKVNALRGLKSRKARNPEKLKLPNLTSEDWFVYCFGKQLRIPDSSQQSDNCESITLTNSQMYAPHLPYLSLILTFKQSVTLRLLYFMAEWLEYDGFDLGKGLWMYSLISLCEKPLSHDTTNALRSLAKLLRKIRSKLTDPSDITLPPLNVLICIISIYYDQGDLADNPPSP